jgi:prephenate dehydratase
MKKSVAVLGPKGTNGHEAANRLLNPLTDYDVHFFSGHAEILEKVKNGGVYYGVVPILNSSNGLIGDTRKFWLKQNGDFETRGIYPILELSLPIKHCLLAHPQKQEGQALETVFSHSEALEQCREAIISLGIKEERAALSTADAARIVAESGAESGQAAIASKFAAEIHGLKIVNENIQDNDGNKTTFHLVSREMARATTGCKTAIIFWLKDEAQALTKALNIISSPGKNMFILDAIFSGDRNNVAFYVEFEGHKDEEETKAILTLLKKSTTKMVILGSFPELLYL